MIHFTLEQIVELHDLLVRETGGSHGVRDMGAVESAVAQPQMGFGGEDLIQRWLRKPPRWVFRSSTIMRLSMATSALVCPRLSRCCALTVTI